MNETEHSLLIRLADALELAFRQAVAQAHRNHAGERFYAYILFTSPLLDYAAPSFNTEEGLAAITKDTDGREQLRWQPPEWKYNWEGQEFFEGVDEILGSLLKLQRYTEQGWGLRWDAFVQAIKRLDKQGIFGMGQPRELVLVNIMWGDQDDVAHVESARDLNPMASYLRYASQELPTLYAKENEIEGSRSMYKEESLLRVRRTLKQVEADLGHGN
jgi:hypothetical protein